MIVKRGSESLTVDQIHFKDRTDIYFPKHAHHKELKLLLSDLLMFVNRECNVNLPRGFDKVDEYERFPLVADIWVYFIHQLEDLEFNEQKAHKMSEVYEVQDVHEVRKVIPFPTDRIKITEE